MTPCWKFATWLPVTVTVAECVRRLIVTTLDCWSAQKERNAGMMQWLTSFLKLTITTNKPKTIAVITVIIHEPKCPFKCGYITGLKVHHHSVTSVDVSWMTMVDKVRSHCSPPPASVCVLDLWKVSPSICASDVVELS